MTTAHTATPKFAVGQKVIAKGQDVSIKIVEIRSDGIIVCKNKYNVFGHFAADELKPAKAGAA